MVISTLIRTRDEWTKSEPPSPEDDAWIPTDLPSGGDGDGASSSSTTSSSSSSGSDTDTVSYDRGTRLCERMSSLGPLSVKICQTLSERPDLVGPAAAQALKRLQTRNVPFEDRLAWAIIKESLGWEGPIAPGIADDNDNDNDNNDDRPTLFREITAQPIATASLGQVYKAVTHEGVEVAVKVQRPDGIAILSKDVQCFRIAFAFLRWKRSFSKDGGFQNGDIGEVIDRVAGDVFEELDYEREALNGAAFEESLSFLGFVTAPVVVPEYSTDRVLVTEWVRGSHLTDLPPADGLKMTRMAIEACTASMVLTGYVHADPHEGNLMLREDGNLVFLDFGLMSGVDQKVMEAFARGIQACLSEDWTSLTKAFKDTGFITDPTLHRTSLDRPFEVYGVDEKTGEDLGMEQLAVEMGIAMKEVEGGTSRFGALATVLNKKISPRWQLFTPPYVLLLIRTFLTLEGIAAKVDPDFNIYQMAMPWAVRRSLSPLTEEGREGLRSALLTEDNRVQWDRLLQLVEGATNAADADADANADADSNAHASVIQVGENPTETDGPPGAAAAEAAAAAAEKARANEVAKNAAMGDAVGTLLGSQSDGAALRRVLTDLDSTDLISRLVSREGRGLRHAAALAVSRSIRMPSRVGQSEGATRTILQNVPSVNGDNNGGEGGGGGDTDAEARPVSEACRLLRERQLRHKRKVTMFLIRSHFLRQFRRGGRGAVALLSLSYLSLRVVAGAVRQAFLRSLRKRLRWRQSSRSLEGEEEGDGRSAEQRAMGEMTAEIESRSAF